MLRSFVNLLRSDPGFRPEHLLTATVSLPYKTYKPVEMIHFWTRLNASLNSVAGIRAAGVGSDLPWTGYDDNIGGFTIEGKKPPAQPEFHARYHVASPDYFRAMGIPLVRGRYLHCWRYDESAHCDDHQSGHGSPLLARVRTRWANAFPLTTTPKRRIG